MGVYAFISIVIHRQSIIFCLLTLSLSKDTMALLSEDNGIESAYTNEPIILPPVYHAPSPYEEEPHNFWHETKPFPHLHGYQTLTNQRHKHQQQSNYYNDIERFDNFITDPPGFGLNSDGYVHPKTEIRDANVPKLVEDPSNSMALSSKNVHFEENDIEKQNNILDATHTLNQDTANRNLNIAGKDISRSTSIIQSDERVLISGSSGYKTRKGNLHDNGILYNRGSGNSGLKKTGTSFGKTIPQMAVANKLNVNNPSNQVALNNGVSLPMNLSPYSYPTSPCSPSEFSGCYAAGGCNCCECCRCSLRIEIEIKYDAYRACPFCSSHTCHYGYQQQNPCCTPCCPNYCVINCNQICSSCSRRFNISKLRRRLKRAPCLPCLNMQSTKKRRTKRIYKRFKKDTSEGC